MKKILITIIIILSIFLIYNIFKDKKIYYVSISDITSKDNTKSYGYIDYIEDYLDELNLLEKHTEINLNEDRITDIIRNINDNIEYEDRTIKNILIKADILTLSVGYNDLISKLDNYNNYEVNSYIKTYLDDLDKLFKLIREYDKEDIVMVGYYNIYNKDYDEIIDYINNEVKKLSNKYKISFINPSDLKEYVDGKYIVIEGQHMLFDKLRYIIDNNIKVNKSKF